MVKLDPYHTHMIVKITKTAHQALQLLLVVINALSVLSLQNNWLLFFYNFTQTGLDLDQCNYVSFLNY